MKASFNVIIATKGRGTLQAMIDSIAPQLEKQDHLTLIFDCELPEDLIVETKAKIKMIVNPEPLGFWGHASRNKWQQKLAGDYHLNADDDDIYLPDAMKNIREKCTEKKLYVFQILLGQVNPIPRKHRIEIGNIGTPCGVYPPIKDLPTWGHVYGGDYEFFRDLAKQLPVEFIDIPIYKVKPHWMNIDEPSECLHSFVEEFNQMTGVTRRECTKCGMITKD